jgi:hypothetical protein
MRLEDLIPEGWPGTVDSFLVAIGGVKTTTTRTGNAAFAAGTLCKFDGVSKYGPTAAGDSALLVEGIAATACGGNGQQFELAEARGQVVTFRKDGNALSVGDAVKPSTTTAGVGGPAGVSDDVVLLNRKAALAGDATSEGRF